MRPSYVAGLENEPEDVFDVIAVGPPFQYVILGFNVLTVELRQMRILGKLDEVEKTYDLCVRNESSLCRAYPERMTVQERGGDNPLSRKNEVRLG